MNSFLELIDSKLYQVLAVLSKFATKKFMSTLLRYHDAKYRIKGSTIFFNKECHDAEG